jgi:hypothetical protein
VCTLRIFGATLDPDALLAAVPLVASAVHRRGEPRVRTRPDGPLNEQSTINVAVSNAGFDKLALQIQDALSFLRLHERDLRAARSYPGVDGCVFDFPLETRDVMVQSDFFPASLLKEMGALGIDLEVSRYPASSPSPE